MKNLRGIYSAVITPMHADESVNYDMLKKIIQYQLNEGVEGFYCCGSSAETLMLSFDERKKIAETIFAEVNGKRPVIIHTGTVRTADAIELSKHAKALGADAVSLIPPYYYKFSLAEIIDYYQDVLNAVDLPLILYNIPAFTGVSFNKENAGSLLAHKNLIGVKHTSIELFGLERMKQAYPDKIFFNGYDEQWLPSLTMGADSVVGTSVNVFYPYFAAVRKQYLAGKNDRAAEIQREMNNVFEVMMQCGFFSATKYIYLTKGYDCGWCRKPFKPLEEAAKKRMDDALKKLAMVTL